MEQRERLATLLELGLHEGHSSFDNFARLPSENR